MPIISPPSVALPTSLGLVVQPSGDTTGATDVANLNGALAAAPTGGVVTMGDGAWYWNGPINITKQVGLQGFAPGASTGGGYVNVTTVSGAVGPFLNIAPGALVHTINLANIALDLSATPAQTGIYATLVDQCVWQNLFVRDGATGYQFDNCQEIQLLSCRSFNQRTRGYYSSHASNVGLKFRGCDYYQSSGATWGANAAVELAQGASFSFTDCEFIRATVGGGAPTNTLAYGLLVTTPAASAFLFLQDTWVDAITDGTGANSASSAAAYFSGTVNVKAVDSFFSANQQSSQRQRAIRINGGSDHKFVGCTISGSGIEFATGNADRTAFVDCNVVQAFSDPAITFTGGAAPTNGRWKGNSLGVASAGIVSTAAQATSFNAWTNGANTGDAE